MNTQPAISKRGDDVRILEICAYPPPRAGWSMRVELVTKQLRAEGHTCVVLNTGKNRTVPSHEYETCLGGWDYIRKLWRYSRRGYLTHAHVNGESWKGLLLALVAELLAFTSGHRPVLTFHAGEDQYYFPRHRFRSLVPVFRLLFALPSAVICNSNGVKRRIVEYGVRPEKVYAIQAFSRQYLDFARVELPADVDALFRRFANVLFAYVRIREGFNLDVLMDAIGTLAAERADVGLLVLGATDDIDQALWADVNARLERYGLRNRVLIWDDLDHDGFLTVLAKATTYVRTPTSDGVASSVLEALALGVPVVAAENGSRPPGVLTYVADDPKSLHDRLDFVMSHRAEVVAAAPRPVIQDTVRDEVDTLVAAFGSSVCQRARQQGVGV